MFQFSTEQRVCTIGGVDIGGQPGHIPTVVVSSIFQEGDRVFDGAASGLLLHLARDRRLSKDDRTTIRRIIEDMEE